MGQVFDEALQSRIGTLCRVEASSAVEIDGDNRKVIWKSHENLHQKFLRCWFIEAVAEAERDGRESDVAIQVLSIDCDDCGVVQVATPEDCRVGNRENYKRDDCGAPESSETPTWA